MSYIISSKSLGSITLNELDTVKSVLQNIAIILSTRQKSVPLYRGFGLSGRFVDKPIPVAKSMMIAEIPEVIAEFEPRAKVVNVTFEEDENTPGKLIPIVEVEINE
jgi:phage baseplate assembly protein W